MEMGKNVCLNTKSNGRIYFDDFVKYLDRKNYDVSFKSIDHKMCDVNKKS